MNNDANPLKVLWNTTKDFGQKASSVSQDIAGNIWEKAVEQSNRIWPEITVPVFLLPIGSHPDQVYCLLDFDDIAFQYNAGHFARPRLEVWCGRSDIQPQQLAGILQEALNQYLEFNQPSKEDNAEPSMDSSNRFIQQNKLKNQRDRAIAGLGGGALVTLTALLNNKSTLEKIGVYGFPMRRFSVVTLIFLAMGASLGIMGAANGLGYWFTSEEARRDHKSLQQAYQDMGKQLNTNNQHFVEAVKNLRLQLHPTLQQLARELCRADGGTLPQEKQQPHQTPPPVKDYLRSPLYLNRLTPRHQWIVRRLV